MIVIIQVLYPTTSAIYCSWPRYWKLKFVHDSSTDEVEEKKGKWTEEEIQRLNEAVHVVTNTSEEEAVYHDIYWPAVSQMVKSRGTEQCRRKW